MTVSASSSPFEWFGSTLNLLSAVILILLLGSIAYHDKSEVDEIVAKAGDRPVRTAADKEPATT